MHVKMYHKEGPGKKPKESPEIEEPKAILNLMSDVTKLTCPSQCHPVPHSTRPIAIS